MTITLDISPEAEKRLQRRASKVGMPLPQLVAGLVEQVALMDTEDVAPATDDQQRTGEPLSAYLERIGILGAVASQPRADGRPWSEVEAACDPH